MKTIKIIDLLNKMANGEEVPKKIKVTGTIYEYDEEFKFYFTTTKNGQVALGGKRDDINLILHYNYEPIIIEEEKKIPEKISINDNGTIGFPNGEWTARNMDKAFAMKINSIIDYLESKEKGE